jgi:uncharacterized protein
LETVWIVIGALFILAGIIGAFVPVVPGPPLSYIGLLILHFTQGYPFGWGFLVFWGFIVALAVTLDSFIPAEGTRRMGGSKTGILGTFIGLAVGVVFFPPMGIIIGPIVGAFAGELVAGKRTGSAMKAAMGSFVGFLISLVLKVGVAVILAYYFFSNI